MTGVDGVGGLRKRRTGYFVQVPRETIRNRALGYKERGILAYLLDMPDGYEPSIDKLAAASDKDGRSAVQSGLQALRSAGYYRVERRRLLNGRFVMGSAVSEVAVPEWAQESAEHGDGPVPLVQQGDGSFMVLRADGSLTDDGFTDSNDSPTNPQVTPDAGFPDAEEPDTDSPETDGPDTGNPSPKDEELKPEDEEQNPSSRPQADATETTPENVVPIKAQNPRGTRLPADWTPSEDLEKWTRENCPAVRRPEIDRFRDYWIAQPGAKGRKTDWPATWRNWCRTVQDRADAATARSSAPSKADAMVATNRARYEAMKAAARSQAQG